MRVIAEFVNHQDLNPPEPASDRAPLGARARDVRRVLDSLIARRRRAASRACSRRSELLAAARGRAGADPV